MATQQQIARQFQRELEAKEEAVTRLKERTKVAEDRNYASATVYGHAFIKHGLVNITKEIESKLNRITSGWATENAAAVAAVKDVSPAVLALITAKGMLDVLGFRGSAILTGDSQQIRYVSCCSHIGHLVFDEILVTMFKDKHPDIFEWNNRVSSKHKGYRNKVIVYRKMMKRAGQELPRWTPAQHHQVGGWLIDRLITATGWFVPYKWVANKAVRGKIHQMVTCLSPSPEFIRARTALLAQAEEFAVCKWPMLCEPNDWSDSSKGGYLTAELRRADRLVRGARSSAGCNVLLDGTPALRMLNTLQKVPYRINSTVL